MGIIIKQCLICGKDIYRTKSWCGNRLRRGPKAVTCSHECSLIYNKVASYIRRINKK